MIASHLAALTFRQNERGLTRVEIAALLAFHFAGLAIFWRLLQQPIWYAAPTLAVMLIVPGIVALKNRRALAVETLAPLFFLYLIIALRFVFIRLFGGDVPGYFDYNAPDLRSTIFRLEPWAVCSSVYAVSIQATRAWSRTRFVLAAILVLAVLAWASVLYIGQRTHGTTGTDPYAYAQMGIDLATRGTPLHRFALFPSVASLNIPWSPIVHTGYHIPINSDGDAPTVWPIGGSFAYALAYRLIGQEGLYLVNPVTSLLLLVATGWLAWELFADSRRHRAWIVALAVAILATSHTLFDWATVTMVDSQAALFTALAITLTLRGAQRRSNLQLAVLSGFALGAAYFVRHTQVLVAPAICVLLWFNQLPRNQRIRALLVAGLAALLVALPDLWYHQAVFGGWLHPESTELNLFSIESVGATINGFAAELLAAREFGWLLSFFLYGAYRLARDKRTEFVAIALWFVVLIGFHLMYPALRLRDLLPEFPPLVIITAFGMVAFVDALLKSRQKFVAASGLIATLFLFLIRVWIVLPIPFGAPQSSFGYLTAAQRKSFEELASLTPPRAVIGSVLNDGAIDLYAQRATFRPADWSADEQAWFIDAMFGAGRRVFLLDDGAETSTARHNLSARYSLIPVAVLGVPLSGVVDGTPGTMYEIQVK